MRALLYRSLAATLCVCLSACLLALGHPGAARAAEAPEPPQSPDAQAPQQAQIVVLGRYDEQTLARVIVPGFVSSHSLPAAALGQLSRWQGVVCASATGLKPAFNELVARRIEAAATSVGALTAAAGRKCEVNVEVVFTSTPQALLTNIDRQHPYLLGSGRSAGDTRITRAVQAWYLTGTRAIAPPTKPVRGFNAPTKDQKVELSKQDMPEYSPSIARSAGLVPDAPYSGRTTAGVAGSYVTAGLRSELLHVLVVVDAQALLSLPLPAVADYISLLSLTRVNSLDTCNALPSILDLLSPGCGDRPKPAGLTPADTAFLKALYSTELDKKLNIEEGELRDRMTSILLTKP